MTIKYFYISACRRLLAILLLVLIGSVANAQEQAVELQDFEIEVQFGDGEVSMKCLEGCAWRTLNYKSLTDMQGINETGMTNLDADQPANNEELSDFLFTISKTSNGMSLTGIEGTAWKSLSFSLYPNEVQTINQFGMVSRN